VENGEMLPRWYGVSYVDYARDCIVAHPTPFNKVISVLREFLYWLKKPYAAKFQWELQKAYCAGLKRGREQT
jgi:hypothetical protein